MFSLARENKKQLSNLPEVLEIQLTAPIYGFASSCRLSSIYEQGVLTLFTGSREGAQAEVMPKPKLLRNNT